MRRRLLNRWLRGSVPDYHRMVYETIGPIRFFGKVGTRALRNWRRRETAWRGIREWSDAVRDGRPARSPLSGTWLFGATANMNVAPFDDLRQQTLDRAAKALRREFEINGRTVNLFAPPHCGHWDVDPESGRRWPQESVFQRRHTAVGDVRFPWELGRMHHVVWFAQAWRYTRDSKWLSAAQEHLRELLGEAPYEFGIHWRDGLQLAVRQFSLIALADLTHDGPEELHRFLTRCVAAHHAALRRQLSPHTEITNNHAIGEACAIALGAVYLDCRTTLPKALRRLRLELRRQLYDDDLPYEGSIPYMRFDLDFLTLVCLALERVNQRQRWLIDTVRNMADALARLTDAGGFVPPIGDGDDARVLRLDDEPYLSINESLNVAAAVSGEPFASLVPVRGFAAWTVGKCPAPRTTSVKTIHLKSSGMVHIERRDLNVWLDCGPTGVGLYGPGGHGHNDTTAIVVHARGRQILHDPGWYTYHGDIELRNLLRSTSSHNTITVDSAEQARLGGVFEIIDDCQPTPVRLKERGETTTVFCGHTGYARLNKGIEYERRVSVVANGSWRIRVTDVVRTVQPAVVRAHLGSELRWDRVSDREWTLNGVCSWKARHDVEKLETHEIPRSPSTGVLSTGWTLEWSLPARRVGTRFVYTAQWELSLMPVSSGTGWR